MRVPVPVLVPYRTTAGHHGLRIMDRSLNPKINVRFMDRSLNACKSFHSKNNVRFMDRSLNAHMHVKPFIMEINVRFIEH